MLELNTLRLFDQGNVQSPDFGWQVVACSVALRTCSTLAISFIALIKASAGSNTRLAYICTLTLRSRKVVHFSALVIPPMSSLDVSEERERNIFTANAQ
jgi:hypothetical protein